MAYQVIDISDFTTNNNVLPLGISFSSLYILSNEPSLADFLTRPKKFLLNNSTDKSTYDRYDELCKEYDFEHIVPEEGAIDEEMTPEKSKEIGMSFKNKIKEAVLAKLKK